MANAISPCRQQWQYALQATVKQTNVAIMSSFCNGGLLYDIHLLEVNAHVQSTLQSRDDLWQMLYLIKALSSIYDPCIMPKFGSS